MKDCNGNYLIWGIDQEYINEDHPELIPNPLCNGCEYTQTCAFRVAYWLDYESDMPEDALDVIHKSSEGETALFIKKIILH